MGSTAMAHLRSSHPNKGETVNKLGRIYKATAIILLNTLIVFVILNLLLGAVYFISDRHEASTKRKQEALFHADGAPVDNGNRSPYQLEWFDYNATKEVSTAFASEVLDEFYVLGQKGFIYQPWVQFSEPPFGGKHLSVDIDKRGIPFRRTTNPPIEGDKSVIDIFVLGGSTTFGYNVADEYTWPSYLSNILNSKAKSQALDLQVNVTNYGRGYYDTSQEMTLIVDLFKNGARPTLVLFMDGVNWGPAEDIPAFTGQVERAMSDSQHPSASVAAQHLKGLMKKWLPLVRLAFSLEQLQVRPADQPAVSSELTPDQREYVFQVLERFKQNREIMKEVSRQYGVEAMALIQPDPVYNYPAGLYRRALPASFLQSRNEKKLFHEQISQSPEIVYLGQLFDDYGTGEGRKAIIDDVHYSPGFNRFLAERVASYIDLGKLSGRSRDYPAVPTGAKRKLSHGEKLSL